MASNAPTPPAGSMPLRSALRLDDDGDRTPTSSSASTKAVQIAEPEQLEPEGGPVPRRRFSANVGKRLSGRPPMPATDSSRTSLLSQNSLETPETFTSNQTPQDSTSPELSATHPHQRHLASRVAERLISQISDWMEHEQAKRARRKTRKARLSSLKSSEHATDDAESQHSDQSGRDSIDSQASGMSLDKLQRIIDEGMHSLGVTASAQGSRPGRRSQRRRSVHLHRTVSSDTEFVDGDVLVPSCDAVLDNSKTMSYSGGRASISSDQALSSSRKAEKERKAWISFKNEIIRLAHTLRLKGWRRVSLDSGESISVERLSGALTNAVYVVSPPDELSEKTEHIKKPPAKLLLRIYGPQVEHIIDRENELSVLRRLARKKIGPRLLGTFSNGRFEQYLNAITLTAADIRDPQTSKKIAKRMRELHEGIELLDEERAGGPAVWKNWDSWLPTLEAAVTFLDKQILSGNVGSVRGPADAWKERGFVCGVEWPKFKAMVDKYRKYVEDLYRDPAVMRSHLIFAHNDTQYGNILRVRPDDSKSPLLQPSNEHKQLVVIDFEYAAANMRGLDFANHFTEWGYNYHAEKEPYAFTPSGYPTPEEQRRFIKAYVEHRPEYAHPGASTPTLTPLATPPVGPTTPSLGPTTTPSSGGPSSSIVEFMLDARVPPGGWREEEKRHEEDVEKQVTELMQETRLWRVANSAQWVVWGVMQAKIPGFNDADAAAKIARDHDSDVATATEGEGDGGGETDSEPDAEEEEFDYLGYARSRAMFFWGDCVAMGLIAAEELPEDVRAELKIVEY